MKKPPQWAVENGLGFDVGQYGVTTSRKGWAKKNRLDGRLCFW